MKEGNSPFKMPLLESKENSEKMRDSKITVVGLGRSGLAASEFLNNLGAKVAVTEIKEKDKIEVDIGRLKDKGIKVESGGHSRDIIKDADLIIASPGISSKAPPLLWAREAEIPVLGELEFASQFVSCPIIAVTGTNGKTTTTTLLGEIFKKKHKVEVAGNIGRPLSMVIPKLSKEHILILEISSFQLERIKTFHPKVSIVLNVTPDHLNRYPDFEHYLAAKERIFLNQARDDYAIFPADVSYTEALKKKARCNHILFNTEPGLTPGVFYRDSSIWFNLGGKEEKVLDEEKIKLKGPHNRENIMAAVAAARIFGEDLETLQEVIEDFSGLEHRLETVSEIKGRTFINDSKSTNADSLVKAIQSFSPVILIAGGRDKGADFTPLRKEIEDKVKEIILFGEAREKLKKSWEKAKSIHLVKNLEEAVSMSWGLSQIGDFIVFSPGCSSFDMFKNFEERGKVFKEIVVKLHKA